MRGWLFFIAVFCGSAADPYTDSAALINQPVIVHEYLLDITPFHTRSAQPGYRVNHTAFTGVVEMAVQFTQPSPFLIFHAHQSIEFLHAEIVVADEFETYNVEDLRRNNGEVYMRYNFRDKLYRIKLHYNGLIQHNNLGLYASNAQVFNETSYQFTEGGYLATQMEVEHARKVVPCIDQPDVKAYWTITLHHPENSTALSNGEVLHRVKHGEIRDYASTRFQRTPQMSSYLVAFVIGHFEMAETRASDGMIIRMFAESSNERDVAWLNSSLAYSKQAYERVREYMDYSLPISKIDGVMVNTNFGGMENFGLITYMHMIGMGTIYHEMIHQWFGNMITNKWWADFWLNEGTTSYFTSLFTSSTSEINNLASSYVENLPVRQTINNDSGYDTNKLRNAYDIGSAFLKMIEKLYGAETMKEVFRNFLRAKAYKSVTLDDFLSFLPPKYDQALIYDMSHSFLDQAGIPVLNIELPSESATEYIISQENILTLKESSAKFETIYNGRFTIPIFYTINGNEYLKWLKYQDKNTTITFNHHDNVKFDENNYGRYHIKMNEMTQDAYAKDCDGMRRLCLLRSALPENLAEPNVTIMNSRLMKECCYVFQLYDLFSSGQN